MANIILEYRGKKYMRSNGKWAEAGGLCTVAPGNIQAELDRQYADSLPLDDFSLDDLTLLGDQFKENGSVSAAIALFERALSFAAFRDAKVIYPRLTSCYRKIGQPQKAIQLFESLKSMYGERYITSVLLTSVASAYCDLKEWTKAKKCADQANAIEMNLHRQTSAELRSVYARIKKESNG